MQDKVCLVTGGNTGIGLETARALARMGATVVLTSRNALKGQQAVEDIRATTDSERVELISLDLASLASVRTAAETFKKRHDRLDVLVNNAGLILGERTETKDGFEATFGVNHLGHFLLTTLLRGELEAAAPARIVNVSSELHRKAKGVGFDDLHAKRGYSAMDAYARSKLANVLFTAELAERLAADKVTAHALHPGVVRTKFGRDGDLRGIMGFAFRLAGPFLTTPEKGARTSVHVASSPDVSGTGHYFKDSKVCEPSAAAKDHKAAKRLWQVSEEAVGAHW
jgi:NAD(P)-dependent dehydrogenase (short-subunit alcohol dehydrogenase family)